MTRCEHTAHHFTHRAWLRHQPVHCSKYVLSGGPKRASWVGMIIISHHHLRPGVARIAFVAEELHHVGDVLLAASKRMLGAGVVDADEKRLPSQLSLCILHRVDCLVWRTALEALRRPLLIVLRRATLVTLRRTALITSGRALVIALGGSLLISLRRTALIPLRRAALISLRRTALIALRRTALISLRRTLVVALVLRLRVILLTRKCATRLLLRIAAFLFSLHLRCHLLVVINLLLFGAIRVVVVTMHRGNLVDGTVHVRDPMTKVFWREFQSMQLPRSTLRATQPAARSSAGMRAAQTASKTLLLSHWSPHAH